MAAVNFANNATSTLSAGIGTGDTLIQVQAPDHPLFPAAGAGDWFPVTVVDGAGNMEIMRCTGRSGNQLTVTRAQEGTTAKAFSIGARVDARITKAALERLAQIDYVDGQITTVNGSISSVQSAANAALAQRLRVDAAQGLNASQQIQGRVNLDAAPARGTLWGMKITNSGSDAVNDIVISAGYCVDSTGQYPIVLSGPIAKQLDAAWAAGSSAGGRDTGAIANATWFVFVIKNMATGAVDGLFSQNPVSPTLPPGYSVFRRIGSFIRASGSIRLFTRAGLAYLYLAEITDRNSPAATGVTALALSVPVGVPIRPIFRQYQQQNAAGNATTLFADGVANAMDRALTVTALANQTDHMLTDGGYITNTAAQLAISVLIPSGSLSFNQTITQGYYDDCGRFE